MNTNTMELNMDELEQVNGGSDWNLWDYIMIKFIHENYIKKVEKRTINNGPYHQPRL